MTQLKQFTEAQPDVDFFFPLLRILSRLNPLVGPDQGAAEYPRHVQERQQWPAPGDSVLGESLQKAQRHQSAAAEAGRQAHSENVGAGQLALCQALL